MNDMNQTEKPQNINMTLIPQNIINSIANTVHQLAIEKGWYEGMPMGVDIPQETEDAFIERACNNLHDEVSELHTAWREGDLHYPCDKAEKMHDYGIPVLTALEEELADIIIRTLDNAAYLGVNIGKAIAAKHAFNTTRPHRHGGKKS